MQCDRARKLMEGVVAWEKQNGVDWGESEGRRQVALAWIAFQDGNPLPLEQLAGVGRGN